MSYTAATPDDTEQMLRVIGVDSVDDLFADIPPGLQFDGDLEIPAALGEHDLLREARRLAALNVDTTRELSFLGYGAYDHFVPAVCQAITSRSEFATAYTPYQPEVSQGTLQAIFEFQTAICELSGLAVANASLYDGATAAAEAMYLSEQVLRRDRAVVLGTVNGNVRAVLQTYARAYGMEITELPFDDATGKVAPAELATVVDDRTACVILQHPNAFGVLEDAPALCEIANNAGAVPVVHCDPLSLGVLEAPGAYGAGVVTGDGQPLGNTLNFGGPSFGFMAAGEKFVRRMPGRIVGETVDLNGDRAYALTLQTREQHIRREKATSNICTNQALNALSGLVYMSWLGPRGIEALGRTLFERADAVRSALSSLPGVEPMFSGPSFREVAMRLPKPAVEVIATCRSQGVHPGFDLSHDFSALAENVLLVAATEQRSDDDIARLAAAVERAVV